MLSIVWHKEHEFAQNEDLINLIIVTFLSIKIKKMWRTNVSLKFLTSILHNISEFQLHGTVNKKVQKYHGLLEFIKTFSYLSVTGIDIYLSNCALMHL